MKIFLFAVLLMSKGLFAFSQDRKPNQVPAQVNNTLLVQFPDAIDLAWHQKQNQLFEATFYLALTEYSALIDPTGHLIMCKNDITGLDLPSDVQNVLQTDYRYYLIENLEKVEKAGKVFYQVALEKNNHVVKQVFTRHGQALKDLTYWD